MPPIVVGLEEALGRTGAPLRCTLGTGWSELVGTGWLAADVADDEGAEDEGTADEGAEEVADGIPLAGASELDARGVGVTDLEAPGVPGVDASAVGACDVDAFAVGTCDVDAFAVGACDVDAAPVGALDVDDPVAGAPDAVAAEADAVGDPLAGLPPDCDESVQPTSSAILALKQRAQMPPRDNFTALFPR